MSKHCLHCGKEIIGLHANAKYCSPECKMICYKERYKCYKKEECKYWAFFTTGESMSPEDFFHNDMAKVIGNIWDNDNLYHQLEEQYKEECYQANIMLHGDLEQL